MKTTQLLFSYGPMQRSSFQHEVLNRKVKGKKDALLGFKKLDEMILDKYPVIKKTGDPNDAVEGLLIQVSYLDLFKLDTFESFKYARTLLNLKSGAKAWVYASNFD